VTAPSIEPTVLGEKVTLSVQVALGPRVAVQVVVSANSPLGTMLAMFSVLVVLVFFTVTVLAALVVPTGCAEKVSVPGVSVTVCASARGAKARRKRDRKVQVLNGRLRFIGSSGAAGS